MQTINYTFPIGRPEVPFTIQFSHVPASFAEIGIYARQVMDCVREANLKANFGLDEKTLQLMALDFEGFLLKLWASSVVEKRANDIIGRSTGRIVERIARIARTAIDA